MWPPSRWQSRTLRSKSAMARSLCSSKIFWNASQILVSVQLKVPCRATIHRIRRKAVDTSELEDTLRSGRRRSFDNIPRVNEHVAEEPLMSARVPYELACNFSLSSLILHRMLKELKLHLYKPRLLHELATRTLLTGWHFVKKWRNDSTTIRTSSIRWFLRRSAFSSFRRC